MFIGREDIKELAAYQQRFLIFSHSGFTDKLLELARENTQVLLIDKQTMVSIK